MLSKGVKSCVSLWRQPSFFQMTLSFPKKFAFSLEEMFFYIEIVVKYVIRRKFRAFPLFGTRLPFCWVDVHATQQSIK